MKYYLLIIVSILILISFIIIKINSKDNLTENIPINNSNSSNNTGMDGDLTMNITINNQTIKAYLENNATTKSLLEMLPLEITMSELNGNEKYYYLDDSLPTDSKNVGTIHAGDIMLYGNNCLVIFYETFNTTYQYTKIGHIDNANLKEILGQGNVSVKIEN